MIRTAELADRIAMVRMARDFVAASGLALPFDAVWAEASAKSWIEGDDKLALVLDLGCVRGMLCAGHIASPLAPVRVASEQVFWIDPSARGRWGIPMVRAYEAWASAQGCAIAGMAAIGERSADVLYRRCGFRHSENHYMKEI